MRFLASFLFSLFLFAGHSTLVSFNNTKGPACHLSPVTKACKQAQAGEYQNIVPLFPGLLADECNEDDEFSFAKKKWIKNAGQSFLYSCTSSCLLSASWPGRNLVKETRRRFPVPAYIFLAVIRI